VSRDPRLFLEDMIVACEKTKRYLAGLSRDEFERDERSRDAVLRNLEILGEAAKRIPAWFRDAHPDVPWRRVAAFRDIVAHEYFGLDPDLVWDIATSKVPELLPLLRRLAAARE